MNSPRSELRGITLAPLHSANKEESILCDSIPAAGYREFQVKVSPKRSAHGIDKKCGKNAGMVGSRAG